MESNQNEYILFLRTMGKNVLPYNNDLIVQNEDWDYFCDD